MFRFRPSGNEKRGQRESFCHLLLGFCSSYQVGSRDTVKSDVMTIFALIVISELICHGKIMELPYHISHAFLLTDRRCLHEGYIWEEIMVISGL